MLTNFEAFDVDGRVGAWETQFRELKDMFNTTLSQRKGQEDAMDLVKLRGKNFINDSKTARLMYW